MMLGGLDQAIVRIRHLLAHAGPRFLLGLAGAPGSGKSTLASRLADAFPREAVIVPMDGFHLANSELERLGLTHRKGAPDTFDSAGYVALLRRLRARPEDETVYAPVFRREIEEAVAGAIAVDAHTRLVITEGNYLLLEDAPWHEAKALLDEVWFVECEDHLRRERLVRRHMVFGRSPQAAEAWVEQTDEPNARVITATRRRADVIFLATNED